jgi:N-succinyldiaminopimelate aminotransferase
MNPDLSRLQPYPFQKLAELKAGCTPPSHMDPILLSIGEPKHPTPAFINEEVISHLHRLAQYPVTRGEPKLREAIADWLKARFNLPEASIAPEQNILPVNGTREALFAFAQAVIDRSASPTVLMPNPFYQIYEGAAFLAGAEPQFINCVENNGYLPNFDAVTEETWDRCQLIYICSPGNPTGAVIPKKTLKQLIELAHKHNFIIASDECYSEIYPDETDPPAGLLEAAAEMGNSDYSHCMVFHSLSKRSNAPGLRSGFIAGDASIIERFHLYRTYHGCAMSLPYQHASIRAWSDEQHVMKNRDEYREKFAVANEILSPVLDVRIPEAGFYLWQKTPVDDASFARKLFNDYHVTVLPGSYLSREEQSLNPGAGHVRIALVAPVDECIEAAQRIRRCVESL